MSLPVSLYLLPDTHVTVMLAGVPSKHQFIHIIKIADIFTHVCNQSLVKDLLSHIYNKQIFQLLGYFGPPHTVPKALVQGITCLHGRCFTVYVPKLDLVLDQGLKEPPEGGV